jgi:hypothetical protein
MEGTKVKMYVCFLMFLGSSTQYIGLGVHHFICILYVGTFKYSMCKTNPHTGRTKEQHSPRDVDNIAGSNPCS